jgi:hypothetical protein
MGNTAPTSTPKSCRFGQRHGPLAVTCVPARAAGREPIEASAEGRPGTDAELLPCRRSPSKQPGSPGGDVATFGRKGARRHGRHRLHSAGDRRGACRLPRRQAVEDEGPMGHRVAEPGLSTLRHLHARDPPARINRGSDVGRMDVPEMRLQGRQVRARAGCTLRRRARVPQVGAVAPNLSAAPDLRLVPGASLQPLPSRGTHNDESRHACERSAPVRQGPTGSLRPQNKLPLQPTRIP